MQINTAPHLIADVSDLPAVLLST